MSQLGADGADSACTYRTGVGAESTGVSWAGSLGDHCRERGTDAGAAWAGGLSGTGSLINLITESWSPCEVDIAAGGAVSPGLCAVVSVDLNP